MAEFKIYKETALPGTLDAHAIYLIAPAGVTDYVEMYVTQSNGVARRMLNENDVQALITAAAFGNSNTIEIVDDIVARTALIATLTQNALILVLDASDDPTVTANGATYAYRHSDQSVTKLSETESMDMILSWDNITGRPTSSPAQIDAAVAAIHSHTNKTQLDKIGEDAQGNMTYGGVIQSPEWGATNW